MRIRDETAGAHLRLSTQKAETLRRPLRIIALALAPASSPGACLFRLSGGLATVALPDFASRESLS
eukprot:13268561-Heterocapsa_arctica.AAC.1